MTSTETPSPGLESSQSSASSSRPAWRSRKWQDDHLRLLMMVYFNNPTEESVAEFAASINKTPHACWMKAYRMGWVSKNAPGKMNYSDRRIARENQADVTVCSVEYCGRTIHAEGVCWKHHKRLQLCR